MKDFKVYQILDSTSLLSDVNDQDKYKTKRLHRKFKSVYILSPKAFAKYREDNEVRIVGRIRKRQRKYKNYAESELAKEKLKDNIIGKAVLSCDEAEKYYDITESTGKHITGYAWIGGNSYLEVAQMPFFLILLPLLLALIIAICFSSCPGDPPNIDFADGNPIGSTDAPTSEQPPNVDLVTFPEVTVLDSTNKTIRLVNLDSNAGNYFISYELYLDGKSLNTDTGAIKPGEQIEIDLWSKLDSGEYELKAVATSWDYTTKQPMPVKNTLITTLAVKK